MRTSGATQFGAVCVLAVAGYAAPVAVYDNTQFYQHGARHLGTGMEQGDAVTLGGAARYVTGISVIVASVASQDLLGDVTVRFYEGGVGGGDPGTKLWDSGPLLDQAFTAGFNTVTVPVPRVLVGDNFTWTIEVRSSMKGLSLPLFGPGQSVGADYDQIWRNAAGFGWMSIGAGDYWAGLGATITADTEEGAMIPLPSATAMAGLGLAGVTLRRRRAVV